VGLRLRPSASLGTVLVSLRSLRYMGAIAPFEREKDVTYRDPRDAKIEQLEARNRDLEAKYAAASIHSSAVAMGDMDIVTCRVERWETECRSGCGCVFRYGPGSLKTWTLLQRLFGVHPWQHYVTCPGCGRSLDHTPEYRMLTRAIR